MRIVDYKCNSIKACFVFEYKGKEVSCSTIANPPEIMVFSKDNTDIGHRFNSVPAAIRYIDRKVRKA